MFWLAAPLALLIASCAGTPEPCAIPAADALDVFAPAHRPDVDEQPETPLDSLIAKTSRWGAVEPSPPTRDYRLGPGDRIEVFVGGYSTLGGQFTVGPDGKVGLPVSGTIELQGLTRDEASLAILEHISPFVATEPRVSIDIREYMNNRVYVLGRVLRPGEVELRGSGTLLQVLSGAGGLSEREVTALLTRAAIIRGSEEILWIDLDDLLNSGNIALNVPLRNGDVVFVPEAEDSTVFVMGSVANPGAVPIKTRISLTGALSQAGGPVETADLNEVYVLRPTPDGEPVRPVRVNFKRLLETGDFTEDLELRNGDIVYVARSGLGNVNYVLRQLLPGNGLLATSFFLTRD
ncbi:MAG: SLBB domain-containing protein [Planctomycetota bacterium]|jgi:polysaccharide export outer membrane protein